MSCATLLSIRSAVLAIGPTDRETILLRALSLDVFEGEVLSIAWRCQDERTGLLSIMLDRSLLPGVVVGLPCRTPLAFEPLALRAGSQRFNPRRVDRGTGRYVEVVEPPIGRDLADMQPDPNRAALVVLSAFGEATPGHRSGRRLVLEHGRLLAIDPRRDGT